MKPSKIIIDGRMIKQTGIGRYIEQLTTEIVKLDSENQYEFLIRDTDRAKITIKADNFRFVSANYRWYTLAEQLRGWQTTRRQKADLVHFPAFNWPILYRGRFVITIHDLTRFIWTETYRKHNKLFGYNLKQLPMRLVMALGVRKAQAILVPTQYVKDQLVARYKIRPQKITVTHEAAEAPRQKPRIDLAKFKITKPYILYVGNLQKHKNIERLILACGKLTTDYMLDYQLVLAGGKKIALYQQITDDVEAANLQDKIIFTGWISDVELAGLYKNATIYSYPSLSEGFGLPGLEAMSYGLPVASSNATCLPEVYGEAAVYYDPENVDDMARVMADLIADQDKQDKLREAGYKQVAKYSWQRCAEQTLAIYKRVLRNK